MGRGERDGLVLGYFLVSNYYFAVDCMQIEIAS